MVFIFFGFLLSIPVFADPPGPPGPGGDPGGGGLPVGAPIDGAVLVLIGLGVLYGFYKLYFIVKKKIEIKEGEAHSGLSKG